MREELERLQEENGCMEKQKEYLSSQLDDFSSENASLLTKNETLQSDYDLLKGDYTSIQKEMNEAREHFQELDVSATKIAHRCEVGYPFLRKRNMYNIHIIIILMNQFSIVNFPPLFHCRQKHFNKIFFFLLQILVQLNATLEEENKALMDQVNKLLSQVNFNLV